MNKEIVTEIEKKGFKHRMFENTLYLNFSSDRLDENREFYISYGLKNIELNDIRGFKECDLKCLKDLYVEGLHIVARIDDFSELKSHRELKYLSFDNSPTEEFDLMLFPNLEELKLDWTRSIKNLYSHKNIKYLWLFKYKTKTKDLQEISNMTQLEALKIGQSSIVSLSGLASLKKLRWLSLPYNLSLSNFESTDKVMENLICLHIERCVKLTIENLPVMPNLKELFYINNGKVASLKLLLSKTPNLEILDLQQSVVEEQDVSYLLSLPKLKRIYYPEKKWHKYSSEDLNERISRK
ncbi:MULTISPECIES: hypothetical protein [unclassified Paraflavitalea]|jgi:hypothetical protein|uniref:hypothetical protein n=1 Tax=unclassified Paraflavitalea TaxID=2798305 RepID=UPI003D359953